MLTSCTCLRNYPYKGDLILASQIRKGDTRKSDMWADLKLEMYQVRIGWSMEYTNKKCDLFDLCYVQFPFVR